MKTCTVDETSVATTAPPPALDVANRVRRRFLPAAPLKPGPGRHAPPEGRYFSHKRLERGLVINLSGIGG